MANLTNKDKRLVRDTINQYVQSGGDGQISLMAYQRAVQWGDGYSFAEIAAEEGVSPQTVAVSVKKVVEYIKQFTGEL
jgi:predicted DNA-binding protein YlxM (UPF0122 family)